tara:strand:- start:1658 stop:1822 length:165 start_codon:yes stop_codon:yes gene_type:complete
MDKNKTIKQQYIALATDHKDQQEQKNRGIYLRDDHCDWGSSGMNEFTEEYSEKS